MFQWYVCENKLQGVAGVRETAGYLAVLVNPKELP